MNWSEDISKYLNGGKPVPSDVLKALVKKYPYFQAIRFKYVEQLFDEKALQFKDELTQLAIQTHNRKVLYERFEKKAQQQSEPSEAISDTSETSNLQKPNKTLSIIDAFLSKEHTPIRPSMQTKMPEEANTSIESTDDLVSETLAKIYVKQKQYDSAIKIYEKLSLLEPEKRAYFARLIKDLNKKKE